MRTSEGSCACYSGPHTLKIHQKRPKVEVGICLVLQRRTSTMIWERCAAQLPATVLVKNVPRTSHYLELALVSCFAPLAYPSNHAKADRCRPMQLKCFSPSVMFWPETDLNRLPPRSRKLAGVRRKTPAALKTNLPRPFALPSLKPKPQAAYITPRAIIRQNPTTL